MAKLFAVKNRHHGAYIGGTGFGAEYAMKWSHRSEAQAYIDNRLPAFTDLYEVVEIDTAWLDRRQDELHAAMMSERATAAEVTT